MTALLKIGAFGILLGSIMVIASCKMEKEDKVSYDLIIAGVYLLDGTGRNTQQNINVYIKDSVISRIDTDEIATSDEVTIINGGGKYLIPGLWDMHAHANDYRADFPKFIHFGVTAVFISGGSTCTNDYFRQMRNMGEQDSVPAPRVFHTSQHFIKEGSHPVKTYKNSTWKEGETVFYLKDTLQIERLVKQVTQYPIEGIKLTIEDGPDPPFIERVSQKFVNKVQREAEKQGTRVFAHISDNIELEMALDAGIYNFVHFTGVDLDFEKDRALISTIYNKPINWVTTLMLDKSFVYPLYPEWGEKVKNLNLFATNHIAKLKETERIEWAKDYLRLSTEFYNLPNTDFEGIIHMQVEQIKELYDNGVNMVLGTDTGNTFIFPGLSLHEEMQLMQLGGMAPVDIIKMGTLNAAKMLQVEDFLGSIEVGKMADMVLLDANPLESISNTLKINCVFKNGKIQTRIE